MTQVAPHAGAAMPSLSTSEILTTTRTVRKRLDFSRPVSRELIEDCLRVAMQAPVASNAFYPHFVVILDSVKRRAIASSYRRAWEEYLALPVSMANLQVADPVHATHQVRALDSGNYLADHIAEAPAIVIACTSPRVDGLPTWIQACLWGSVLPHAWSFMLAARAHGLVSAWTQVHLAYEEEIAGLLAIDYRHVQQAALIAVAHPIGTTFKPGYREPLERFVHWDAW